MIWGPFVLALALGLIVSAGLYFAYLWQAPEPVVEPEAEAVIVVAAVPPPEPAIEPAIESPIEPPAA